MSKSVVSQIPSFKDRMTYRQEFGNERGEELPECKSSHEFRQNPALTCKTGFRIAAGVSTESHD
jgi:hypothetical protein